MPKLALFARLEAKPGKEADVEKFLQAGLGLARQEATTPIWFALRLGPTTFGVFDAFYDEAGRQAHLAHTDSVQKDTRMCILDFHKPHNSIASGLVSTKLRLRRGTTETYASAP